MAKYQYRIDFSADLRRMAPALDRSLRGIDATLKAHGIAKRVDVRAPMLVATFELNEELSPSDRDRLAGLALQVVCEKFRDWDIQADKLIKVDEP